MRIKSTGLRWLWVTIIVIALDRITKILAQKYLMFQEPFHVMPFFNLTLSYNRGSAFSFLDSASGWQVYIFAMIAIIVSIVLLIYLFRMKSSETWLGISFALIIAGALGNLWDRFAYGHVIDFIQWYAGSLYWPTFNIADSAVCIGAVMFAWDALRNKK